MFIASNCVYITFTIIYCFALTLLCPEPQKFSKDGHEEHMQVNHLAPALLSVLLLPSLIRGSPSRIVNVNSVVSYIIEMAECIKAFWFLFSLYHVYYYY